MSDRSQIKNLDAPVENGTSSLENLRASKDLGLSEAPPSNTDLSQVSIAVAGVERLSAKAGKRIISASGTATKSVLRSQRDTETEPDKSAPKKVHTSGILMNPYFPYQGNLLERFVTLLANICKFLEQLLLKLLGGGDAEPIKPSVQKPQKKEISSSEEDRIKEAHEKIQRELSIHRS